MLQREHSAILSTFIKLPFVIETFVFSSPELKAHVSERLNVSYCVRSLLCLILNGRFTQVLLYRRINNNDNLNTVKRHYKTLSTSIKQQEIKSSLISTIVYSNKLSNYMHFNE